MGDTKLSRLQFAEIIKNTKDIYRDLWRLAELIYLVYQEWMIKLIEKETTNTLEY